MPYICKHEPTLQIVEVEYAGSITARDLRDSTSKCITLEKEKGIDKFLFDTTRMQFDATLFDIFDLPTKQYIKEGADRSARVAVIHSNTDKEKKAVRFYETTCRNRGWQVGAFSDRQNAMDWLTRSTSSNKTDAGNSI